MKHLKIEGKGGCAIPSCAAAARYGWECESSLIVCLCRSNSSAQRLFPGEQDALTNLGELTLILVLVLVLVLMQNFAKVKKSILGWFNGVRTQL